jgi:hypothetical protein
MVLYDPERQSIGQQPPRSIICWTRMQAEAGQGLELIMARKELERRASGGTFLWGVGNAPGTEPARLAREDVPVDVIFSVMKSRPKERDANASELNVWRGYVDEFGVERQLPAGALVTSRAGDPSLRPRAHYALMCRSEQPLGIGDFGPFDPLAFRNVGGRGAPVGASQVTALLRETGSRPASSPGYRTNFRATLTGGYWVRLTNSLRLGTARARALIALLNNVDAMCADSWLELVADLQGTARRTEGLPKLFDQVDSGVAHEPSVV